MSTDAFATEAERQRRLIDGLLAARADESKLPTRETGARALRGLQAYRVNANASAERALGAAFPTVRMLIGQEDFEHLAPEFWRADPPVKGDLAEWGAGFAAWVAAHEQLRDWPYLGDCARLDWALHVCERSQDHVLDGGSLARLGDTDPSRLAVVFAPGVAIIESRWPIGGIHRAHRDEANTSFDAVREAIAQERGEAVIVSRRGWKSVATVVDAATAHWTRQLLEGCDLATAIDHAGESFDFTAWLTNALQSNWVKEIRVTAD
jgi:putative DNA-binding protein